MSTSNSKEEISSEVEHKEKVICKKDIEESLDLSFWNTVKLRLYYYYLICNNISVSLIMVVSVLIHFGKHIQSVYEKIKYSCNLCEYQATTQGGKVE